MKCYYRDVLNLVRRELDKNIKILINDNVQASCFGVAFLVDQWAAKKKIFFDTFKNTSKIESLL